MARIRTIKPEFFTSEDIVSLSPLARLLFVATWCEADKAGRLTWKPRTMKMRYFPADNCDIDGMCRELVDAGLVVPYGDGYAWIPGFEKHQHVNPRESSSNLPEPPDWRDGGPKKVGKTLRESVFERDGFKCVRCNSTEKLEADHILPQSMGGPNIIENLRTLCKKCNAGRPVSGKALDEDLGKDGFSVQSLRVKFGIDASIPDVHAQGGREGKGKEENKEHTDPGGSLQGFEPDPVKQIFDLGVNILTRAGHSERAARTLVGRLRSLKSDEDAAAILVAAKATTDPAAYIVKACKPKEREVSL